MRKLILSLPIALAGCTTIQDALAPAYVPQPIHIYDLAKYTADNAECAAAGAAYVPKVSLGTAASRIIDGATSETSLIPISPLVPAYGAAGGALGAANDGLDLMSAQHAAVYRNCLHDETLIDHSAVLVNPKD